MLEEMMSFAIETYGIPNCWLIRHLPTPESESLNVGSIFCMSIHSFAMVLYGKRPGV